MLCRLKSLFQREDYEEVHGDEKLNSLLPCLPTSDNRIEISLKDDAYRQSNNDTWRGMTDEQLRSCANEKWKAFLSFLFLCLAFFISSVSLAFTHDRLPDRTTYKPLPDALLDNLESREFFLNIAEIQIIVVFSVCIAVFIFHKHRFVIARRCFFLLGVLYIYRSICFSVTVLPISSATYYCSPQNSSSSALEILKRAMSVVTGFGLSINHKQIFCGDSIFSGHATILIFCYLVINEYAPNKLKLLRWLSMLNAFVGISFLLLSHAHYTIDIVIAYYVTTRLFWSYHKSVHAKSNCLVKSEWWSCVFNYFENHSNRLFVNEFELPGFY